MNRIEVPALVVGGGPVGLASAVLLDRQGVRSHVAERREGLHRSPQAHVLNCRTLEICRELGLEPAVRAAATGEPRWVRWMTRLAGDEFGHLDLAGDPERVRLLLESTPSPPANVSQHRFEPILAERVASLELASLGFGQQWESLEQDADGVTSRLSDLVSGETFEVRSRWLLAADGAGSRVRRALGIEMEGPAALAHMIMIHFEADLRALVGERPAVLYWVMDPRAPGVFIAHDLASTWVLMSPYDPARQSPDAFDDDTCEELVAAAIGADADFEIRSVSPWTMTAQIAGRYREGRVFLVGDAAHRFPPTGGIGLNTGVQDAHNLAWKLGAVEAGWAPASLLESYGAERRDIARDNTHRSLTNAIELMSVTRALGVSEDTGATLANFAEVLADPARGAEVKAAIDAQIEHFDMLGLDLGFAYERGALMPDGTARPVPENPTRDYLATTRPGHRLPHAWVEAGGQRRSTLDLLAPAGFTLITGGDGGAWVEAAARQSGVPLRCVSIGPGAQLADPDGAWARVSGIAPNGALLVRPDGHVAWRSEKANGVPAAALARALAKILEASERP